MLNDIRIEDNFEDVISKAAGSLGVGNMDLSQRTGVPVEGIRALMDGELDEGHLLAVAEPLGLHGPSLVELAKRAWRPEKVTVQGLFGYNTPFPVPGYEEMTVNSFLVVDKAAGLAVAFDTGADVTDMLADLEREGVKLELVLLTHTHDDHIKALDKLLKATGNPPVWVNNKEAINKAKGFDAGKSFTVGGLTIESRLTNGHSPGGTTFVISGLERPVAIVGDSLFCCSQGGARGAYGKALDNNRKQILSLTDNTVLCPGHGPVTTVAEEKAHNPFFPEFKS
jgi:glyoxylase-like metal-dependent hydrolase (beta-lactamase superfamily II)